MKIVVEGEETVNYSTQAAFLLSIIQLKVFSETNAAPHSREVWMLKDTFVLHRLSFSFQDQRWVSLFGPEMRTIWMSESKCNRISYWTTPSFQQPEGKATAQSAASPDAIGLIKSSTVCIVRRWDKRQRWFCDASDSDWHKRERNRG